MKSIHDEAFERFLSQQRTHFWDEDDETPETEPTDEPDIILDGDDDQGEDTDED